MIFQKQHASEFKTRRLFYGVTMNIELVLHTPRTRILLIDQTPYGQLIKKRIDKQSFWSFDEGFDVSIDIDVLHVIRDYCRFRLFRSDRQFFKQIRREINKYLKEIQDE